MHGMLSLSVLVAAFVGLAGWVGYVSVRLYRACPAGRTPPATTDDTHPTDTTPADQHTPAPDPVA